MNCLIIDDNKISSLALEQTLLTAGVRHVYKAVQPYLLRSLLAIEQIDFVFVRIKLWDYRVFEKVERMPIIVYIGGKKDKLTDNGDDCAMLLMQELFSLVDIKHLFQKIQKKPIIQNTGFLFVRSEGRFIRVKLDQIEMIEKVKSNRVIVWGKHFNIQTSGTLPAWIRRLPEGQFIRSSDTIILPFGEVQKIVGDKYEFRGREILLTYKFAASARKEMEIMSNWPCWPSD